MSNELEKLVTEIKNANGWNVEQVAQSIKISRVHLTRVMKEKSDPKILSKLKAAHPEVVTKMLQNADQKELNEDQRLKNSNRSINVLTDEITASNRDLSIAAKDNAESIKIIATSNSELVQLLKKKVAAGAVAETSVSDAARMADLLEVIADIAVGKRFGSKQEALAALNRFVPLPQKDK